MWYAVLIAAIILVDQVTKIIVAALSGVANTDFGGSKHVGTIIKGFIEIEYAENDQGMMGLARFISISPDVLNVIFICVTVAVLVGICIFLHFAKKRGKWINVTLSLVIAGAIGNLIDRCITTYVRDFIHVYIFGDAFPFIFNVSDMALVIGAVMLIIYVLFMGDDAVFRSKKSKEKRAEQKKAAETSANSGGENA